MTHVKYIHSKNSICPAPIQIQFQAVLEKYPIQNIEIVSGSLTVQECAKAMKESLGSAVLISESEGELSGIFTDRDLFLKLASHPPSHPDHLAVWDLPVRSVMSRPLVTLTPETLHLAPEVMSQYKIHHIPIVAKMDKSDACLLGVLTMDAVFSSSVSSGRTWRDYVSSSTKKHWAIGIISEDRVASKGLVSVLQIPGKVEARELKPKELGSDALIFVIGESFNYLVIDLEGKSFKEFAHQLKIFIRAQHVKNFFLLLPPGQNDPEMKELLSKMAQDPRFTLLAKPVDPQTILDALFKQT